jgi:hypothetical protein
MSNFSLFPVMNFVQDCKIAFLFSHLKMKPKLQNSNITVRGKPQSSLGQVFNFKLGSFTDNTINSLNANGHF